MKKTPKKQLSQSYPKKKGRETPTKTKFDRYRWSHPMLNYTDENVEVANINEKIRRAI